MKDKTFKKKLQNNRYVKSEVLKYIRTHTEIIQDLNSNHTDYYHIPNLDTNKNYVLVDWEKVCFVSGQTLLEYVDNLFATKLLIDRNKILSSNRVIVLKRWF